MTTPRIVRLFEILLLVIIVLAGFGQAVLQLWNWLMPGIFGLPTITYWKAVGLMALSWILFGGFRGRRPSRPWRHGMRERWEKMSPEQRDAFARGMRSRCGETTAPGPESSSSER